MSMAYQLFGWRCGGRHDGRPWTCKPLLIISPVFLSQPYATGALSTSWLVLHGPFLGGIGIKLLGLSPMYIAMSKHRQLGKTRLL